MDENKLFYVGLKAFIEKEGEILILRESSKPEVGHVGGQWELPGGRIQHSEDNVSLQEILLREIEEECGSIKVEIKDLVTVFRRQFSNGEWVFLVGYDCRYIDGEVRINDESTEFAWLKENEIEKYDFVNGYREAIYEYFNAKKNNA